jgi:hypothetical protein
MKKREEEDRKEGGTAAVSPIVNSDAPQVPGAMLPSRALRHHIQCVYAQDPVHLCTRFSAFTHKTPGHEQA